MEMDADEEERKEHKKGKELLNTIEGQTLNGNRPNPLKKRDLEGNIVDSSDSTKKPKINTFESAMLNFLAGTDGTTKNDVVSVEDVTKNELLAFTQGTTMEMMLEESGIRNADQDTVEILYDIGIELMIDIYFTRGWAFGAEKFKDAMEKMQMCDSTVRTVDRYTLKTVTHCTYCTVSLYISIHCPHHTFTVHCCTYYVLCLPESDFTSVRHSCSHTCSLSVHLLNT